MSPAVAELPHLLSAIRLCLARGGRYLVSRCAPYGPIMREPNLSYIHKAAWGMHAAGVDHALIARLLDWAWANALQPNGDFYCPGEGPEYKDGQRAYRTLTFGKVAAWIGHPLIRDERVVGRLLQYQHASGGCFNYIGDGPRVEERPTLGTLNTSFFGHLMLALGRREEAIRAGDWLRRWVAANAAPMAEQGVLYSNVTLDGALVTALAPGARMTGLVDRRQPKQEFWQVGTTMAYLAALYDRMRREWGYGAESARPYLESALALLDYEATMPLETYLWPSKCKVAWGAGELLRVLVAYGLGSAEQVELAYQAARKTAVFTFMDNQLPHGGWSCMHYPTSELAPELAYDYKPLAGLVAVPDAPIPGSPTIWLPSEEITGEFLGEIKSVELGVQALLERE